MAGYIDDTTGRTKFVKYKGDELAYVDQAVTLETLHFKNCISRYASLGRLSSEINSHRDMDKRMCALRNGLLLICHSPRVACNLM